MIITGNDRDVQWVLDAIAQHAHCDACPIKSQCEETRKQHDLSCAEMIRRYLVLG